MASQGACAPNKYILNDLKMKHFKFKYNQLLYIIGFALLGFLSSCNHDKEDMEPAPLEDSRSESEDENEEICLPNDPFCNN